MRACITGEHVLEETTLIAGVFNISCRLKLWSFLVSECSLGISLVDTVL